MVFCLTYRYVYSTSSKYIPIVEMPYSMLYRKLCGISQHPIVVQGVKVGQLQQGFTASLSCLSAPEGSLGSAVATCVLCARYVALCFVVLYLGSQKQNYVLLPCMLPNTFVPPSLRILPCPPPRLVVFRSFVPPVLFMTRCNSSMVRRHWCHA